MAHKEVINISTIFSADIANVNNGIKTIRQNLDTLKLSSGLEKNFLNLLSKLDTEMSNFEAKTKDGLGSKLDSRALEKSGRNILELYRQLQVQVKALGTLSNSEFKKMFPDSFGDNIAKSTKALSDYAKETKKTTDEIQKQSNALAELQKKQKNIESQAATLSKKKANTTDAAYNILSGQTKTARASATKASNRELEAQRQIEVAKDSGAKVTKTGNLDARIPANRELIESLKQAQEEARKTMTVYEDLRQKLSASIPPSQIDDEQQKVQSELNKTKSSIDEVKQTLSVLESLSASSFDELKATLSEITGLDFSNIIQAEEGFQQLANAINSIQTGVIDALKGKIDQLENSTEGVAPAIENIKDGMEDAGKAVDDLTRREEDIDRLKEQILDFFSIGNAIQLFKRAVTSALETVKDLDAAMTETAVVTEFSVGDMWSQLPQYTKRANELGVSIKGAYEAATLYYQQGLKTNEVIGVSNETLKMARIANIEAADATNLMTAALRGFNMEVNEANARDVNDVYSNLAAITAADTEEIGIAMSKTASIAKSANMEFNTTAALLSQIIETTREAPETAGTAMKTIIARFTEVKKLISEGDLIGADEEGEVIDVNKIDTALKTVGISLKGFLQGTEGIDDIFLKLASKWDTLDISTQRYIATMAAGSRQQSRFLAMMGDYDRTMELVGEANNSAGASQQQFEKTLASMESKLAKLKNAWDEFVMGLANNDILKRGVDALTLLLNTVNSLLKAFSGSQPMIKTFLTGLLAFGGFKLGKNILERSGVGGILGKDANKSAKVAGEKTGATFFQGFKEKIKKTNKNGLKDVFRETFTKYNITSDLFSGLDEEQQTGVKTALSKELEELAKKNNQILANKGVISDYINEGKINEAIAKTKEYGGTLQLSAKDADQFGLRVNKNFELAATGAQIAGGALLVVSSIMESLGANETAINTVRTIGTVLMGVGTVMSLVSNIFTTAGAKIAIAGATAQLGWWWLIAIVAAIGAVTAAFIHLSEAAHKASLEGQLEDAKKATEAAKKSAEKAKTAYSEFLSEREEYNGLQETLKDLTKGTQDWRDALAEANQNVLDLLINFPELRDDLEIGEDGQLIIREEGMERKKEKAQRASSTAQMAEFLSQNKELYLQNQTIDRDLNEKFIIPLTRAEKTKKNLGLLSTRYYDKSLIDAFRGILADPPSNLRTAIENIESDRTVNDLIVLMVSVKKADSLMSENQKQMSANARAALTAGMNQEQLEYTYSGDIIDFFSKQLTTEDYLKGVDELAQGFYESKGWFQGNDDTSIKSVAKKHGVEDKLVEGDELENLRMLYSTISGIPVGEFEEGLSESAEDLKNAIAQLDAADTIRTNAKAFQEKMEAMGKKEQKELAGLLSGDGSQFTLSELSQVKDIASYFKSFKYYSVSKLLDTLGYVEKSFSELSPEDQKTWEENREIISPYTMEDWNAGKPVPAFVQLKIDSIQAKEEMYAVFDEITSTLAVKTGQEKESIMALLGDASLSTLENIAKQTSGMGGAAAKEYIVAFSNVLSSKGTGSEAQTAIQNLLSATDISSMASIIKAMDYMQEAGVDPAIMKEYWDSATDGAHTFVSTLAEALSLIDRLQGKLSGVTDIADKLSKGTATYEEMNQLIAAGADISGFQLTAEGWEATSEEIETATGLLRTYYVEQASAAADQHAEELANARKVQEDRSFGKANITVYNEETDKYEQLTRDDGVNTMKQLTEQDVSTQLGINAADYGGYGTDKYWEAVAIAYQDYLNLLNNGEEVQSLLEKQEAYAQAIEYTADENAFKGESDESVRYSMQNEAQAAGLDSTEITASSEALKELGIQSQQVRDRLALDIALASKAAEEITNSYEEWEAAINDGPANPKYASSLQALTKSTSQLLGVSEDVTANLLKEKKNRDLVAAAANGDIKAYQEIQKIAAKETIAQLDLDNFRENADEINSAIDSLISEDIEVGATLDSTQFGSALYDLLEASGATVDDINAAFESIGWEPQVNYKEVPFSEAQTMNLKTTQEVLVPDGVDGNGVPKYKKTTMSAAQSGGMDGNTMVRIPILGDGTVSSVKDSMLSTSTFKGKAPGAPKSSKKGGGGGGGKKEKWENPYDELYNLTEKANEALRQREKIERDYDRLLKNRNSTSKQILANSLQEIANLQKEIALQKQLQAGRSSQISKLGSETFKDKKGNEKSFSDWGVTKYASYDEITGTITIDWEAINKITDTEKGAAVEEYISKLEELSEQFEETQDTIEDMEDIIREIQERGKTEYVDFEQRIYDALVAKDQEVIDNLSEINDSINDSNARLLDSIQMAIDEQRQARERDEQRNDIEEKQRRLALLKSDTSGANALEIKALEEEIGDLQQSYTDSLVDDSLAQLQKQNDDAAEQRERQIEIMQNQLDYAAENGAYWEEVSNLLSTAFNPDGSLNNNSALIDLLKETEGFKALSEFGGMQWIDELIESWLVAQEGLANWKIEKAKQNTNGVQTQNAGTLKYNSSTGLWNDTSGGTYSTLAYDPATGQYKASGYTPKTSTPAPTPAPTPTSEDTNPYGKASATSGNIKSGAKGNAVKAIQYALNKLNYGNSETKSVNGIFGSGTVSAVKAFQKAMGISVDGIVGKKTREKFKVKGYLKGGLADYTGPAWMDGTPSKPELVLDAKDTQNFIVLKNILADVFEGRNGISEKSGDNYFEIHIEVDKLENDYDVEQVAEKVKRIVNEDARYRNVNAINLLR